MCSDVQGLKKDTVNKMNNLSIFKYLPRYSNSSQSKTDRPKDTLVSTRHAAEFMGQPTFRVKQMRPNCNSDGDAYKENSDPDNNIQKEDDAVTPHPHERKKNEYVAKTSQKREHERKLDLGRQNHEHDENLCSMNAPNTSYNEAGVDDLNITAHKGLRQSLIMAIEKIQQDSDTDVATLHRKIQDETRDSV